MLFTVLDGSTVFHGFRSISDQFLHTGGVKKIILSTRPYRSHSAKPGLA